MDRCTAAAVAGLIVEQIVISLGHAPVFDAIPPTPDIRLQRPSYFPAQN